MGRNIYLREDALELLERERSEFMNELDEELNHSEAVVILIRECRRYRERREE